MRFNFFLVTCLLLSSLFGCSNETRHVLSEMKLESGRPASLDIFGSVVSGTRNQSIHFETGVVPIPFVQTKSGLVNLDVLRDLSFSEHNGRASAGYLHARALNISEQKFSIRRFEDISLTALKRSRRIRTTIAQFPLADDFSKLGYTQAIFTNENYNDDTIVFYGEESSEAKMFSRILGRQLQFPVSVDTKYLIENLK